MKSKFFILSFLILAFCACEDPNVTLNTYEMTLYVGQESTLVATCDNPLSEWTVSNDFVASCSYKGEVRAKHVGKTSFYIRNYYSNQYSATCELTVLPNHSYWAEPYLEKITNKTTGVIGNTIACILQQDGFVTADSLNCTSFAVVDTAGVRSVYYFTENLDTAKGTTYTFSHCDLFAGEKFSEEEISNYIEERFIYKENERAYQDGEFERLSTKRLQKLEDEETHNTILRYVKI